MGRTEGIVVRQKVALICDRRFIVTDPKKIEFWKKMAKRHPWSKGLGGTKVIDVIKLETDKKKKRWVKKA